MKLPDLFISLALMSTVGCLSSATYATEVRSGGRAGGDRDASAPLLQHTLHKVRDQHIAEGGADRLKERQIAADGSDRLQQNQIAADGADRLNENRVADNSSAFGTDAVSGFCLACR